jgi:hypothetical protein
VHVLAEVSVPMIMLVLLRTRHAYELATGLPAGQLTEPEVAATRI